MGTPHLFESLETRSLLAGVAVTINFQPAGAATPAGTVADTGGVYAARNGYVYGWDADNSAHATDRNATNAPDQAHDTFAYLRGFTGDRAWQISVPDGSYSVRIVAGDASYDTSPVIKAEGTTVITGTTSAADRWIDKTQTIAVTDGKLTLTNGSTASKDTIDFITIMTAGAPATPPVTPPVAPPVTTTAWPSTSAWKLAASSPIARFEAHSFSYQGKLYVMGGWADKSFNSTTRVDVYDPATNVWTRLHDMQAPETHAGAVLDAAHGVIYFVAGHRGKYPSTPTNGLWKYTIATDSWQKLSATLPYNMGANSCQIVDNKLYSFGGNYADRVTNDPDMFELDLGNIAAGFKKIGTLPQARDHLASVVIGGKIYALGGEFGHDVEHDQQNLLQRYDPATNTWTYLAPGPNKKSHAEGSTFVLNGKIVWAAGQVDTSKKQQPSSSVYQYDPATNKWTTLASLPAARQGTQLAAVGNYWVYTTGGINTDQPQSTTWTVKIAG